MGQSGDVVNFESKEKKKKVMVIIVRSVVLLTAALCLSWMAPDPFLVPSSNSPLRPGSMSSFEQNGWELPVIRSTVMLGA